MWPGLPFAPRDEIMVREEEVQMASNRKRRDTERTRAEAISPSKERLASIVELLSASDDAEPAVDIAGANLACASGLPAAGSLDIERYLEWLDEAARKVQIETTTSSSTTRRNLIYRKLASAWFAW